MQTETAGGAGLVSLVKRTSVQGVPDSLIHVAQVQRPRAKGIIMEQKLGAEEKNIAGYKKEE